MVESQTPQPSNVFPLKAEYRIFGTHLRQRLEEGLKPTSNDPKATVESFEQILSLYIVAAVKKIVTKFATSAGNKLAKRVVGV